VKCSAEVINTDKSSPFQGMSYPDLVAYMKQENTPPGAGFTLDYWIENAFIDGSSFLLDLACSTGFSSRYCYDKVGATAEGVDLSHKAVEVANEKAKVVGASRNAYKVGDACQLPYADHTFTHVLGGCNFAFIQDREKGILECKRVLKDNGILCVSNYFYFETPPVDVIDAVERSLGWRPDPSWDYDYWNNFYQRAGFVLGSEMKFGLEVKSESELFDSICSYIRDENECTSQLDASLQEPLIKHFYEVRKSLNEQRNYQGVAIQLWHK